MSRITDIAGELRELSIRAGRAIMEVYEGDFAVASKDDTSPLTEADLAAHHIITTGLAGLPLPWGELPVISEEGDIPDFTERSGWLSWWLVDPLDGTKEFVKRNGEFTVNIALIQRPEEGRPGEPVAGWVYAPVHDVLHEGIVGWGARRIDGAGSAKEPSEHALPREGEQNPPRIVASRSHRTPETDAVIKAVENCFGVADIVSSGSSLKLCRIAEGSAELYPRPAPTMEWDTAAADAVCRAAGARVAQALNGQDLEYGKENLLNPWFVVSRAEKLIACTVDALSAYDSSGD